jgi:hypothetical protein
MSDRLKELQHQRNLAREQLAWIEREIARELGPVPGIKPPEVMVPARPLAPSEAEATRMADEIMARYQGEAATAPKDVKRGCFLYFGLAFLLLGAAVAALYFYSASRQ